MLCFCRFVWADDFCRLSFAALDLVIVAFVYSVSVYWHAHVEACGMQNLYGCSYWYPLLVQTFQHRSQCGVSACVSLSVLLQVALRRLYAQQTVLTSPNVSPFNSLQLSCHLSCHLKTFLQTGRCMYCLDHGSISLKASNLCLKDGYITGRICQCGTCTIDH